MGHAYFYFPTSSARVPPQNSNKSPHPSVGIGALLAGYTYLTCFGVGGGVLMWRRLYVCARTLLIWV